MKLLPILVSVIAAASLALAQDVTTKPAPAKPAAAASPAAIAVAAPAAAKAYTQKQLYPLSTCVVSGEELEGDGVKVFEAGGRSFKTCCGKCQKKVEADPATFAAKLDAAIVQQQVAAYPLEVCPISGKKLGSMGDPIQLVLDDTLVQLCCKGCVKKATAGAAAIVERVHDAAFAAQRAQYPLSKCVVSGEALGKKAVDVMYGTTLVRFCCEDCTAEFEKSPAECLAKIAAARAPAAPTAEPVKHEAEHAEHAEHGKKGGDAAPMAGIAPLAAPGISAKTVVCGTECVTSATGGGCCAAAATAGPAKTGCCDVTAVKPVTTSAKSDCCSDAAGAKPVVASKGADCCDEAAKPVTTPPAKVEPVKKIN